MRGSAIRVELIERPKGALIMLILFLLSHERAVEIVSKQERRCTERDYFPFCVSLSTDRDMKLRKPADQIIMLGMRAGYKCTSAEHQRVELG
jgi:hypothetical protein